MPEFAIRLPFRDRAAAGCLLAQALVPYARQDNVVVLGLPRGGVPVAYDVAKALAAPLDVFTVRKLGVPGREELAFGAIASGGVCVLSHETIDELRLSNSAIDEVANRERKELERRERLYRQQRPNLDVAGKIAILVDDGLATGATMLAAVLAMRQLCPEKVIVAVPIASSEAQAALENAADECVCLAVPERFRAVSMWYEDFPQLNDQDVQQILARPVSI